MNFILLQILFASVVASAQNSNTIAECLKFKDKVTKDGTVTQHTLTVPLDYSNPSGPKFSVYYWMKKGTDPKKVPLLLIHGGPGANSWRYYSTFKDTKYTGDIIAMDNRNEGCSNVKSYEDRPQRYSFFRARHIVRDLEFLRKKLYGDRQWRIFGQSRGSAISHYYLEMFPNSLESVQTHGFAMMTAEHTKFYTLQRSHFSARASGQFAALYPEAADVVVAAKDYFRTNKVCLPTNLNQMNLPIEQRPRICGAVITDSLSFRMTNFSRWPDIRSELLALRNTDGSLNTAKVLAFFQTEVNGNIYVGFMNYILGTNGQDVSSPSPQNFPLVMTNKYIQNAIISEGRFVSEGVYTAYLAMGNQPVAASADILNFSKVKKFLVEYEKTKSAKFPLVLFSSLYDPVAGPEMYVDEKKLLGDHVDVRALINSGHEGWSTEAALISYLFR